MPSKLDQILRDAGVTKEDPTEEELTQYMPGTGNTVKIGELSPEQYRENKLKNDNTLMGEFNVRKFTPRQMRLRELSRKVEAHEGNEWIRKRPKTSPNKFEQDQPDYRKGAVQDAKKARAALQELRSFGLDEFVPEVLPPGSGRAGSKWNDQDYHNGQMATTRDAIRKINKYVPGAEASYDSQIKADMDRVGYPSELTINDGTPPRAGSFNLDPTEWRGMDLAVQRMEDLKANPDFRLIHRTREQYLPGVAEQGLVPHDTGITGKNKAKSYQTDKVFFGGNLGGWDTDKGKTYGDAVLRLKYTPKDLAPDYHDTGSDRFAGHYQSRQSVQPKDLEIKLPDGTWEDLLTHMKKKPQP